MRKSSVSSTLVACLLLLGLAGVAASAAPRSGDPPARIPVDEAPGPPQLVTAWDPDSPQELVRIDGALYQKDSGFYYPAADDRITVRLAPGVSSWAELLERARNADPQAFGILDALTPERVNRLGIVDLLLPDRLPAHWCELVFRTGLVRYAEVSTYGVYTAVPNDPLYPQQWALNNTGQTGGTPGADVDAQLAWDISAGHPSIVVGVLDSGTSIFHEDLAPNTWHNEDEIPNNNIDDDNNGFIDDVDGWDFGNNNNNVVSNSFHGTHVTGVVNARGDNGLGVIGLAGGIGGAPGVRTMAVAVGESAPITTILDDALLYATDNGAHVITLSLIVGQTQAINDALDYAYNQNDVFIDCAAGNNGASVGYPANRAEVMAVASTTDDDQRSSFSNPGPEVEVAAPGSSILSTQLGNSYGTSSGTSFAAPYVGALAALIRSVNPGMPAADVRQLIIDTAEDVESPGFDNLTGWGRINAYQALLQAGSPDGTIQLDAEVYTCAATMTITVEDSDLGGSATIAVTVTSGAEPAGESVSLSEAQFGVFSGTLPLGSGTPLNDGVLQASHADTLTAEYLDADDGQGGTNVLKSDTATTDCIGPQIFNVAAENVDDVSATITWTTDEAGTSVVRYGEDIPLDQQANSGIPTTTHSIPLTGLDPCTAYSFEVESVDAIGNVVVDDNGGSFYTFQTLGDFPGIGLVPCQNGLAVLDSPAYGCAATVQASVADFDLNADPGAIDTVQVQMTSTSEPTAEWITLTESGVDSGFFEGSIDLTTAAPAADGGLSVSAGDLITITYHDADTGEGQTAIATATSREDCAAPMIQNLRVTTISSTRAVIEWDTDEPATSVVEFGPDDLLGSLAQSVALTTSHSVPISAFEACDGAFFRVSSADEHGDLHVADLGGQPFQFQLNQIGGLVFHDNFETDTGWNLAGEWERGSPQGLGSPSGDPAAAFSGSFVLGQDLSGGGSFPGDYEPGQQERAVSPLLDTTGSTNLELILNRKLGVSSSDEAIIDLINVDAPHAWTSGPATDDADWVEVRYDVSALDDQLAVRIAFVINAGFTGSTYGWNIDEVIIKDSTQPDYLSCGGCASSPAFGGLTAAYDPAPCAASGVTLEWASAVAWGGGDDGTYDVHRGTTASFIPDATNLIASGISTTTFTDTAAPVNTEVWYAVRARNNEDCGGEGLTDDNLVRLPATETVTQPAPGNVGASLVAAEIGSVHLVLSWGAAANADHYIVRRSSSMDFSSPVDLGVTSGTSFEDLDVVADADSYAYRVFAVNACGVEETP